MCDSVSDNVAEQLLSFTAVHPLTGRPLPVFVVTSRQYGEYNDVDLGNVTVICHGFM